MPIAAGEHDRPISRKTGHPLGIRFRFMPLRRRDDAGTCLVNLAAAYIENQRRVGSADARPELLGRNKKARGRHKSPPLAKETALGLASLTGRPSLAPYA